MKYPNCEGKYFKYEVTEFHPLANRYSSYLDTKLQVTEQTDRDSRK